MKPRAKAALKKSKPDFSPGKKTTNAQKHRRVLEIYNLIIAGQDRPTITEYAETKWGVCQSVVDAYTREAREWIKKGAQEVMDEGIKGSVKRRLALFAKAFSNGELQTAEGILRDLDKLLNRYPSEKHRVELAAAKGLADLLGGKPLPNESGLKAD